MSWYKLVEAFATISGIIVEQKSILVKKYMEEIERVEFMEKIKKMCEDKGYKFTDVTTEKRIKKELDGVV